MNGFTKQILSIVLDPSEFFPGFEDVSRIIIVYDVEKYKVLPKQSLFPDFMPLGQFTQP